MKIDTFNNIAVVDVSIKQPYTRVPEITNLVIREVFDEEDYLINTLQIKCLSSIHHMRYDDDISIHNQNVKYSIISLDIDS